MEQRCESGRLLGTERAIEQNNRPRVVISGMAVHCSVGDTLAAFVGALRQGRCGYAAIPTQRFSTNDEVYRCHSAATLPWQTIESLKAKDPGILGTFGSDLAREALLDSDLDVEAVGASNVGMALGTTVGATYSFMSAVRQEVGSEPRLPATSGSIVRQIASSVNVLGPAITVSTACAAGTDSIGRAAEMVASGRVQVMLAGGIDIFSELTFSGFNALQALSRGPCRPFDEDRDGMMLGDGGAVVVIEREDAAQARGARIYSRIDGYGFANEAYHSTSPAPDGSGALAAMRGALSQAGLMPGDLDYINAHGTGTRANDETELSAIQSLLGADVNRVFVSSTKSMTGHTLGAAGSIEIVATSLAMREGFVPPTINLRAVPIRFANVPLPTTAVPNPMRAAMSNSLGFGGTVASIVLTRGRSAI